MKKFGVFSVWRSLPPGRSHRCCQSSQSLPSEAKTNQRLGGRLGSKGAVCGIHEKSMFGEPSLELSHVCYWKYGVPGGI